VFKSVLETLANIALLVLCALGIWMYASRPPAPAGAAPLKPPGVLVSLDEATALGNPSANVALVIFSDFQCPFCSEFATESLPSLIQKYVVPGKVLLAFRQLPIASHRHARQAATLALCAGQQGQFWTVHDDLFKNQRSFTTEWLTERAKTYNLDAAKLQMCVNSPEIAVRIDSDMKLAQKYGVRSTPSVFVGTLTGTKVRVTKAIAGAQPTDVFGRAIDALLK